MDGRQAPGSSFVLLSLSQPRPWRPQLSDVCVCVSPAAEKPSLDAERRRVGLRPDVGLRPGWWEPSPPFPPLSPTTGGGKGKLVNFWPCVVPPVGPLFGIIRYLMPRTRLSLSDTHR